MGLITYSRHIVQVFHESSNVSVSSLQQSEKLVLRKQEIVFTES